MAALPAARGRRRDLLLAEQPADLGNGLRREILGHLGDYPLRHLLVERGSKLPEYPAGGGSPSICADARE